jgi:lipopolysaccharide biosynthesis glycosyltransferase
MLIAGVDAKHCIDEIYYCRRLHDNNITLVCDNGIFEISPEYIAQTIRRYTLPDMKKKLLPKVNVAFCFDKFFLKYAVTTITSLVYNNKGKCCYGIFCVVDTTIELADKNRLENIVKRFSPCSTLYFISADSSFDCSKTRHFTKAIYFRMLLPELLPDIDKIIYLDTDLVVCDALLDLYNTDIGDNLLAGIYDNCVWRIKWVIYEHFHLSNGLKLNRTEYINSGVLLMNLYKLREVNLKKTWIDLSINKNLLMPDQDILNYSCAGQKFILPLKYNYNPLYLQGFQKLAGESIISPQDLEEAKTAAVIYHFYGEKKPWNSNCPAADIWRKYAEIAEQHLLPQ